MLSGGVFMVPFCEKGVLKSPRLRSNESPSGAFKRQSGLRKQMEGLCPDKLRRLFRTPKFKINFPLNMRKATTTTAASGGNREELLGQRPARRKCRPRHEADAGCRNPENAERIQMVFFLGYTKASRRYTATRYAAMKHQMMGSHRMTAL